MFDGSSAVALIDEAGRQRVYTVPGNWTGDRTLAQPGHGVLDLSTLAPQPGFASIATAIEGPAFDPEAVVRIDVHMGGSGALDDVMVCLTAPAVASRSRRDGSSPSAVNLTSNRMPVLGATWRADLDCSAFGPGTATLVGRRQSSAGTMTPFGELLVSGALVFGDSRAFSAAASVFNWYIPLDLSLVGLEVHFQGTCEQSPAVIDGKLRPIRGGLSDALDLVLGSEPTGSGPSQITGNT